MSAVIESPKTKRNYLKPEEIERVTDIYIPLTRSSNDELSVDEGNLQDAYAYCGDNRARFIYDGANKELTDYLLDLFGKGAAATVNSEQRKFRIQHNDRSFRAHRTTTVEGQLLDLRVIAKRVPLLDELVMPKIWNRFMVDPELLSGGLFIVGGLNGQGKTTVASSMLVTRQHNELLGSHAIAIEDPPEMPLHGEYPYGMVVQKPISEYHRAQSPSGFPAAIEESFFEFPAARGGGTTLYLGEVRNPETAAVALEAAANGHLVILTTHGPNIHSILLRLYSFAKAKIGDATAAELLASNLKGCIFQRMATRRDGKGWHAAEYQGDLFWVTHPETAAANILREAKFDKLRAMVKGQQEVLGKLKDEPSMQRVKEALGKVTGSNTP